MKCRSGFVSNSSSSSFVVSNKSSWDVLVQMFKIYEEDCDEDKEQYFKSNDMTNVYNQNVQMRNKVREIIEKHKGENINYVMPFTTNYETFIYASENNIVSVYTCNNIFWDNLEKTYNVYDDYLPMEEANTKFLNVETNEWTTDNEISGNPPNYYDVYLNEEKEQKAKQTEEEARRVFK